MPKLLKLPRKNAHHWNEICACCDIIHRINKKPQCDRKIEKPKIGKEDYIIQHNNKIEPICEKNIKSSTGNITMATSDETFISLSDKYDALKREYDILIKENEKLKADNDKYKQCINKEEEAEEAEPAELVGSASTIFVKCINNQKEKEKKADIWKKSIYKDLCNLESNNVGNVGEMFIQGICESQHIDSNINGTKTKQKGETKGTGDGTIKQKPIEIKLARKGAKNPSFQHELGERPWTSNFMTFVDVTPDYIYLSSFPNFSETHYRKELKWEPYFPNIKAHWRKKEGAFKFTSSEKTNNELIKLGYCIKITHQTTCEEVGAFINNVIL